MITVRTPFRMSFFGGGTDFPTFYRENGGTVVSATLDKYCYVTLRHLPPFFDYRSEFVYSKTERVSKNEDIEHPLIREILRWQDVQGVRMTYDADLPARAGLGSSSAFAVGLLHAIHAARGESVSPRQLADEAVFAERTLCRECGGVQDQIASAFGGFNRVDFEGDGYTVTPLLIGEEKKTALESRLMLFFTGTSRLSFELQAAHGASLFKNKQSLCLMRDLAREASDLFLKEKDSLWLGEYLHRTWQEKRSLTSQISTPDIDRLYEKARSAGAVGGKLLGAGGGGFLLFYVPPSRQEEVKEALSPLLYVPVSFSDRGSELLDDTDTFLKK